MGVSGQRYSSSLGRALVSLCFLFASLDVSGAELGVEDPRTAVRLPPAIEGMLLVLIGSANLQRPSAIEPLDHKPFPEHEQVLYFGSFLKEMVRVYESPEPYNPVGKPISTMGQYVSLIEPTRVYTGSVRGDMTQLFHLMQTDQLPRAVHVEGEAAFGKNIPLYVEKQLFDANRQERVTNLLRSVLGESAFSPTIVGTVLAGVTGALFTTRTGVSLVRALSDHVNGEQATPEVAKSEHKAPAHLKGKELENWYRQNPRPKEAKTQGTAANPLSLVTLASVTSGVAVGPALKATADALETSHDIGKSEESLVQVLKRISESSIADQRAILKRFHDQIHSVVLGQIYGIGTAASRSPEIQGLAQSDARIQKLITVFFDEYIKLLPSDVIKNIMMDLVRAPVDTTDYHSLGIVLRHYPPIAQQFFQTVSELAGAGSISEMFKKIRDTGLEVPLDQVERIIAEDPNHYPLKNLRLTGKAGKLYQLVYADYENADGSVIPVAVRILKPGVEQLLEAERAILHKLSGQLAHALKKNDGTGPSPHRLEQLVDMIYGNLHKELRVDLTVANQNEAAARLSRRVKVEVPPHENAYLNIQVPKAFAALPGSQVMVMERVNDIVSAKEIGNWFPELPHSVSEVLMDVIAEELMTKPMANRRAKPSDTTSPRDLEGLMHVDLHSGNLLFQKPRVDREKNSTEFHVAVVDFGLVEWLKPKQIDEIAKLAVGAGYNSSVFITEALWALRDPKMDKWDSWNLGKAQRELESLVLAQSRELNRTKKYWGTADWVQFVWEKEVIDFPPWLISLKQGYRAAESSHIELGRDPRSVLQQERTLTEKYRWLFARHVRNTAGTFHAGWRPIVLAEVKSCIARVLGMSGNGPTQATLKN